jgi:hypothetical protein
MTAVDVKNEDPIGYILSKLVERPWILHSVSTNVERQKLQVQKSSLKGLDIVIEDFGNGWQLSIGDYHNHFAKTTGGSELTEAAMDAIFGYSYIARKQGFFSLDVIVRSKAVQGWVTSSAVTYLKPSFSFARKFDIFRNRYRFE